jgi:hypothetical protein
MIFHADTKRRCVSSVVAQHAASQLGAGFSIRKLLTPGSILITCALIAPPVLGDCKCRRPEKGDGTRWGGNQAVVVVPEKHFREIAGTVETFQNEPMEGALVEVFDKPDYLVSDKLWAGRPEQKRLKSCVTSADGKFCFSGLPSGTYEVRISKDQGWNVTHAYVVLDRKAVEKIETLRIMMHIGT